MNRFSLIATLAFALGGSALADPNKPAPAPAAPKAHASKKPSRSGTTGGAKTTVKGGFRFKPNQIVPIAGFATVWVYSPYVGQYIQVLQNPSDGNTDYPSCGSVQDCGDGELGYGAVCDRASFGLGSDGTGVCREACRDDNDCPTGTACTAGLDPDDTDWLGCL